MDEPGEETCPSCGSVELEFGEDFEYTGGGFGDTLVFISCLNCSRDFRGETRHGRA